MTSDERVTGKAVWMKHVFYVKGRPSSYAYPAVLPTLPDAERLILFDGKRKGPNWMPPAMIIPHKDRQSWDVATCLGPAALIVRDEHIKRLFPFGTQGLELFRVQVEGIDAHIVNITAVTDCLDVARCRWRDPMDATGVPEQYAFYPERLQPELFKIPQTACGEVLVFEDTDSPQQGFKQRYEAYGLGGIVFQELWRG